MANPVVVQSSVIAMTAAQATVAPTLAGVAAGSALALAVFDTSRTSGYAATGVAGGGATWYRGNVEPSATGVVEWWYGLGGTGGSITVTATMTGSDTAGAWLAECSGVSLAPAPDPNMLATVATGSTTTPTITPIPTMLGELILVASLAPSTETASPGAPYTTYAGPLTAGAQRCGLVSWVTNTLTGTAAAWTCTTGVWNVAVLALKPRQPQGYVVQNDTTAQNNAGVLAAQARPDYVDSVVNADALLGYGVLSGCDVSPNTGTDLKFQVGVGTALSAWGAVPVAAATAQAVTAADATNPRRDLVYVTPAGVLTYTAGVANAMPCPPTLPAQGIALAFIDVPANATQVDATTSTSQAHVIDKRVMLGFPQRLQDYYTKPTGALFETSSRSGAVMASSAPVSGVLYLTAIVLPAGLTIGHLAASSDSVAASTPTHYWFALYDSALNQLAATADQTTTAWGTFTLKSLAIATTAQGAQSTFTTTYTGVHYFGIMETATTSASIAGFKPTNTGGIALAPVYAGSSDSAQTTVPAFPHVAAALSNNPVATFYAYVAA
jgi:hypothetical protein